MFYYKLDRNFKAGAGESLPFPRGAVSLGGSAGGAGNARFGAYGAMGAVLLGAAMLAANLAYQTGAPQVAAEPEAVVAAQPSPAPASKPARPVGVDTSPTAAVAVPARPAAVHSAQRIDMITTGAIAADPPAQAEPDPAVKPPAKPHRKDRARTHKKARHEAHAKLHAKQHVRASRKKLDVID